MLKDLLREQTCSGTWSSHGDGAFTQVVAIEGRKKTIPYKFAEKNHTLSYSRRSLSRDVDAVLRTRSRTPYLDHEIRLEGFVHTDDA